MGEIKKTHFIKFHFIGQERSLVNYANEKPVSKQRISEVTCISLADLNVIWAKKHVQFNFNYVYSYVFNGSIPKVYFSKIESFHAD